MAFPLRLSLRHLALEDGIIMATDLRAHYLQPAYCCIPRSHPYRLTSRSRISCDPRDGYWYVRSGTSPLFTGENDHERRGRPFRSLVSEPYQQPMENAACHQSWLALR